MPEQLTEDQIESKNLSTADLIRLANEEIAQQIALRNGQQPEVKNEETQEQHHSAEQGRDENGRFVKNEEEQTEEKEQQAAPANESDEQEEKEIVYRQVIDLGDGSGVQVFEGKSMEELVEKLVKAQKNATKKIREQEAELKKHKQADEDTEYVTAQELQAKPVETVKKIVRQAQQEVEDEQKRKSLILQNFLAAHPDIETEGDSGTRNGNRIYREIAGNWTSESFEKAYRDLKADGLLVLKTEEAHDGQEQTKAAAKRIAEQQTEEVPPQRIARKSSGVSTKARPAAAPKQKTPEEIEAELYSMPMEELRRLGMSQK